MSSQNPSRTPRRIRGTSLSGDPPELILPPYEQQLGIPIRTIGTSEEGPIFTKQPTVSSVTTEFRGKSARNVTWNIGQAVTLDPNTEYPYPVNFYEDGELIHFSASVNDESLFVLCVLYDLENKPNIIADDNARSLAEEGKGLTVAELDAIDMNGISLDKGGRAHNVATHLSRAKSTFSFGHLGDPYETIKGTKFDKRYVIEYGPLVPQPYKRIYFTIQNRGSEPKLIHKARVIRMAFVDEFETVVKEQDLGPKRQKRTAIIS